MNFVHFFFPLDYSNNTLKNIFFFINNHIRQTSSGGSLADDPKGYNYSVICKPALLRVPSIRSRNISAFDIMTRSGMYSNSINTTAFNLQTFCGLFTGYLFHCLKVVLAVVFLSVTMQKYIKTKEFLILLNLHN
jgi:hypothetical protein